MRNRTHLLHTRLVNTPHPQSHFPLIQQNTSSFPEVCHLHNHIMKLKPTPSFPSSQSLISFPLSLWACRIIWPLGRICLEDETKTCVEVGAKFVLGEWRGQLITTSLCSSNTFFLAWASFRQQQRSCVQIASCFCEGSTVLVWRLILLFPEGAVMQLCMRQGWLTGRSLSWLSSLQLEWMKVTKYTKKESRPPKPNLYSFMVVHKKKSPNGQNSRRTECL